MYHNSRPSLPLLAGLLAFCWLGSFSALSATLTAGTPYTSTSLGNYYKSLRDDFAAPLPYRLPLTTMPSLSPADCFVYCTVYGYGGIDSGAFLYPPIDEADGMDNGPMETNNVYPVKLAYLSAIQATEDGLRPFSLLPSNLCDYFNDWPSRAFNLLLDPAIFYPGTVMPIWPTLYSVTPSPSSSCYTLTDSRQISKSLYLARAYVVPQRVRETNDWAGVAPLWDMYGDGRMFVPRIIFENGFLSKFNVSPFDGDFWEQLVFNSRMQTSQIDIQAPVSSFPIVPETEPQPFTSYDTTGNWRTYAQGFYYDCRNKGWYNHSPFDLEQYPYLCNLLGQPHLVEYSFWNRAKYIPESVQKGDFGWSHYAAGARSKNGYLGVCLQPVSSQNGAVVRARRFHFVPYDEVDETSGAFGIIVWYRPSGIAWDANGGLVFDWLNADKPISSLFRWPYLSSWDFDFWHVVRRDGGGSGNQPWPPPITKGPNSLPVPEAPVVAGAPKNPVPPQPVNPAGGGLGGGGGVNGGGGGGVLNGGAVGIGQGNGDRINAGQIVNDVGAPSSSLNYNEQGNTTYMMDDSGDLVGEYNIDFPGYSDIYFYDDFVNPADDDAIAGLYEWSAVSLSIQNYAITDFSVYGSPVGQFGESLRNVDMSGTPRLFGDWNSEGSWFYQSWTTEPILPSIRYLVLPWPDHSSGEWDWSSTHEFEIPERLHDLRTILLLFVLIGESAYFVVVLMRLFQGGN